MSVAGFPVLGCSGLSSAMGALAVQMRQKALLGGTGLDEDSASEAAGM